MKLIQERFRLAIRIKNASPRGWLTLEQGLQGSGHSTKRDRVQEVVGQCSQEYGGILVGSCTGSGVGLGPDESVLTQHTLYFYESMILFQICRV